MPPAIKFLFQADKAHFTFKTNMDPDRVRARMASFGAIKIYSFVHELGDEEEEYYPVDHVGPYEHTHVFVKWAARLNVCYVRVWDIDNIHPHLQASNGMMWAKGIIMKYHLGHKTKACGKKYFIPPVLLIQEDVEEWNWEAEMFDICLNAPKLIDAAKALNMVPKSLGDINLNCKQGRKKEFAVPEFTTISRFLSNVFPRMAPHFFLVHDLPCNLAKFRYPHWVFFERTRILSEIQFTTYFIELFVVQTERFVGCFVHVILTRQTCGQRSSKAAETNCRELGNYYSERICHMSLISKCRRD